MHVSSGSLNITSSEFQGSERPVANVSIAQGVLGKDVSKFRLAKDAQQYRRLKSPAVLEIASSSSSDSVRILPRREQAATFPGYFVASPIFLVAIDGTQHIVRSRPCAITVYN